MKELTPQMLKAIELLKTGDISQKDVADQIGVARQTITQWKKENLFIDELLNASKQWLKQHIPEIYKSAAKEAKNGSYQHTKVILDHLDRLEEIKNQNTARGNISFTWQK